MRRYWIFIGLGAVAVFAAGMLVVTAVRRASHGIHQLAGGWQTMMAGVPQKLGPVRLDGVPLGTARHLRIWRDTREGPRYLQIQVALADSALERLQACNALAAAPDSLVGKSSDLRCLTTIPDSGSRQIGELLTGDSDSVRRPIFATVSQAAKFDSGNGDDKARAVDIRATNGGAHVVVEDWSGHQLVSVDADSQHGARITIRDSTGKALFHLRADSAGVTMGH